MKKVWKGAALVIGLPVLLVGWLTLDSYTRAVSAIAAHDARLRSEIAAIRSKRTPSTVLEGRDVSWKAIRNLPCARTAFQNPSVCVLEGGHTAHLNLYWTSYGDESFLQEKSLSRKDRPTPHELITALAVTDAAIPEGGFSSLSVREAFEYRALERFPDALVQETLTPAELQRIFAEFNLLMARRLTLGQALFGEHLLDQIQTLSVLHTRSDSIGWIRRPPGWKEFFSWRILLAKCLNQLEDEYQDLSKLPPESFPDRDDSQGPSEKALTRSKLEREAFRYVDSEKVMLCYWHMARLAIAIVRYRVEKAKELADLKELVPEYLPELPVNPHDGKSFLYREGHLKTAPFRQNAGDDWDLNPK